MIKTGEVIQVRDRVKDKEHGTGGGQVPRHVLQEMVKTGYMLLMMFRDQKRVGVEMVKD